MSENDEGEKSPPMLEKSDIEPEIAGSGRELGRILGVSHAAVQRALRSKRIAPLPDGTFHVPTCRLAWHENTALRGGRPSAVRSGAGLVRDRAASPDRGIEQVEVPADATAAVTATLAAHGAPVDGLPSLRDAQTAHEILKARRAQLDVDRLRGKLVERDKAHDVLTTFNRTVRDHLLGWPAAAAPAIAADLELADLARVERVILTHLRALLESMATVPPPDDLLPSTT